MYVCMHVCMYVRMYVCMNVCTKKLYTVIKTLQSSRLSFVKSLVIRGCLSSLSSCQSTYQKLQELLFFQVLFSLLKFQRCYPFRCVYLVHLAICLYLCIICLYLQSVFKNFELRFVIHELRDTFNIRVPSYHLLHQLEVTLCIRVASYFSLPELRVTSCI